MFYFMVKIKAVIGEYEKTLKQLVAVEREDQTLAITKALEAEAHNDLVFEDGFYIDGHHDFAYSVESCVRVPYSIEVAALIKYL